MGCVGCSVTGGVLVPLAGGLRAGEPNAPKDGKAAMNDGGKWKC